MHFRCNREIVDGKLTFTLIVDPAQFAETKANYDEIMARSEPKRLGDFMICEHDFRHRISQAVEMWIRPINVEIRNFLRDKYPQDEQFHILNARHRYFFSNDPGADISLGDYTGDLDG